MTDRRFSSFLVRSLVLLQRDSAAAYARVALVLEHRPVLLCVDGELMAVRAAAGRLSVVTPRGDEGIVVETSRLTIQDLVEGRRPLLDTVLDDALHVRGAVEDVLALFDAMIAYVEGAVRSPSFASLLEEYLSSVGSQATLQPHRRSFVLLVEEGDAG